MLLELILLAIGLQRDAVCTCTDSPGPSFTSSASEIIRGKYRNVFFGFSVKVPKGIEARSDPPPTPDRGFGILLPSGTYISFLAQGEHGPIAELENERVANLKTRTAHVRSLDYRTSLLGRTKAQQLTAVYDCGSSETEYMEEFRLVFDEERHTLYEARIVARKGEFAHDKRIYEEIAKTWGRTPLLDK